MTLVVMRTFAAVPLAAVAAVAAVVALRRWLPGVLEQANREHAERWRP